MSGQSSDPPRVAFAGTPAFSVPALTALVESGADVPLVLTQPDRPAGRGRAVSASQVKRSAERHGLRVEQPARLDDAGILDAWGDAPDVLVVVAYGLLLPRWLLDWPRCGCINAHASLLPRWRGAAPIQHAILAGDATTGVSIMRMDTGLDRGPVFATEAVAIGARATAGDVHDRLASVGAELLSRVLPDILAGRIEPVPQDENRASYAPKIRKSDARLDFSRPADVLDRQIRAFNPWPVAEASLTDGRRLRIWEAEATGDPTDADPGTILAASASGLDVATGRGVLRVRRLQAQSAKQMDVGAYLAAHDVAGVSFAC